MTRLTKEQIGADNIHTDGEKEKIVRLKHGTGEVEDEDEKGNC